MINQIIILLLLFSNIISFAKQCNCDIYQNTLKELNKEFDKSLKPYSVGFVIDSTFDPTIIPKTDTIYYSNYYVNEYKFFISDKINENYWCKGFIDFITSEYKSVSNDSLFKIDTYDKRQSINLSKCRFEKTDSISFLHFNGSNYFELKEKANASFSTKIIKHKNHNDTISYTPIIIYFSEIVCLNKDLAYFNIRYDFSQRQYTKSVFFRKEKNKWKFYKFGKEVSF